MGRIPANRSIQVKHRVLLNRQKIVEAPGFMEEVLDQIREIIQTASNIPDIISQAEEALAAIGQKAKADSVTAPKDLMAKYWSLGSHSLIYVHNIA
jgi:hypothetical protein